MNQQGDKVRDRIVANAGPIFSKKGFGAATVREICDAAHVNLASVNYYFGDKQGLYMAVLAQARDARQSRFPYSDFLTARAPSDRLRDFIGVLLNRLGIGEAEGQWETQLLVRELMRPDRAGREIVEGFFRPYFEMLLAIVNEAASRPLTREESLQIGFSVVGQCLHYRVSAPIIDLLIDPERESGIWDLVAIADHITSFTLGGIAEVCARTSSTSSAAKS